MRISFFYITRFFSKTVELFYCPVAYEYLENKRKNAKKNTDEHNYNHWRNETTGLIRENILLTIN